MLEPRGFITIEASVLPSWSIFIEVGGPQMPTRKDCCEM